jgi:hypothetical protein
MITLLLQSQADVSLQTHVGRNALHFAVQASPEITSAMLLSLIVCPNRLAIVNR